MSTSDILGHVVGPHFSGWCRLGVFLLAVALAVASHLGYPHAICIGSVPLFQVRGRQADGPIRLDRQSSARQTRKVRHSAVEEEEDQLTVRS